MSQYYINYQYISISTSNKRTILIIKVIWFPVKSSKQAVIKVRPNKSLARIFVVKLIHAIAPPAAFGVFLFLVYFTILKRCDTATDGATKLNSRWWLSSSPSHYFSKWLQCTFFTAVLRSLSHEPLRFPTAFFQRVD